MERQPNRTWDRAPRGRIAAAGLAAMLVLAADGADAYEMRSDPAFTQQSGFAVVVNPRAEGPWTIGSEALTMARQPGAPRCPASDPQNPPARYDLVTEGWMRVSLQVPARWVPGFEVFARQPAATNDGRTQWQILQATFQGANALLTPMVQRRPSPSVFSVVISVVPSDCHTVDAWDVEPSQAMRRFELPMHVQQPMMLEPLKFQGLYRWLLAVAVHEGTHTVQLAPYDRQTLQESLPGSAHGTTLAPGPDGMALSLKLELGAMLVEHGITEALLPRDDMDRAIAETWRTDRSLLERLRSPTAPQIELLIRRLEVLERSLGWPIHAVDEERAHRLLALCAAVIRDPALAESATIVPTPDDRAVAAAALAAARKIGPPIRLSGPPPDPPPEAK